MLTRDRLAQLVDVRIVGARADPDEEAGARVAVDAEPYAHHRAVSVGLSARELRVVPRIDGSTSFHLKTT